MELHSKGVDKKLEVLQEKDLSPGLKLEGYELIVTAGVNAARKLNSIDSGDAKILYTLMPRASYRWLLAHAPKPSKKSFQVLYLDQPLNRYISLVRAMWAQSRTNLGVMYSEDTEAQYGSITKLADSNVRIITYKAKNPGEIISMLQTRLGDIDALLLLPDSKLFNQQSMQAILLTSFRLKLPVIGFSEGFVRAGAVAAISSNPGDIGRQAAEIIHCQMIDCREAGRQEFWPEYFTLSVNRLVSGRLGIAIPEQSELVEQIKILERTDSHE